MTPRRPDPAVFACALLALTYIGVLLIALAVGSLT